MLSCQESCIILSYSLQISSFNLVQVVQNAFSFSFYFIPLCFYFYNLLASFLGKIQFFLADLICHEIFVRIFVRSFFLSPEMLFLLKKLLLHSIYFIKRLLLLQSQIFSFCKQPLQFFLPLSFQSCELMSVKIFKLPLYLFFFNLRSELLLLSFFEISQ